MSIESVWISALDKRADMVIDVERDVISCLGLPLNKFWSGDGNNKNIQYDRIDWPSGPELFKHCNYGNGEGRRNHANAFLSHRDMFRKILSQGYNNALILEEDIYFIKDRWRNIFYTTDVQNFINSDMWDGVYFGYQIKEYPEDTDDGLEAEAAWATNRVYNIERAKPSYINISGLHAILLGRKLLERLSKIEVGPMDSYLGQNLNRFRLYYFKPKIIGALGSYSCAENRWQSRSSLV